MSAETDAHVLEFAAKADSSTPRKEAILVVGYDGSPPSQQALEKAAELLESRNGWLEVVFVAHSPTPAPFAPEAVAELRQIFDEESAELEARAGSLLIHQQRHWRFQRRDGGVAGQLLAVADELQRRYGQTKDIGIVVGAAAHRLHHVAGAVAVSLARAGRFPLVVVPAAECTAAAPS
ncbi:MAG TPA: universal stress protein [Acidimicrobiales bacterium]|nr:universal stress protein [Acidimicrobiales bacterium]